MRDAKAMLLVGDDQPESGKVHPGAEQGVSAHHQIQRAQLQPFPDVPFFPGLHAAGEQSHPDAGALKQGGEGLIMLGGQNFCGGHECALPAALSGQPDGSGGDHGLAAAHVALQKPVHRFPGGQIGKNGGQRGLLGMGQGVGQQVGEAVW